MIANLERGVPYVIAEPSWPVRWRCYLLDVVDDGWPRSTKTATRFVDARSGELVTLTDERVAHAAIVLGRLADRYRLDLDSMAEHIEPQPYGSPFDAEAIRLERIEAYRAKCDR